MGGDLLPGDQERVRAQEQEQDGPGGGVRRCRQHERPGERRRPERPGDVAHRLDQVRAGHGAERGGHHRHAHRGRPPRGGGEVGAGIAGLQVGRRAGAVDEQRHQQQRHAVRHRRSDHPDRTQRTGPEAEREPHATPGALGDPPHEECRQGRTEREQRGRQARRAVATHHVLRQQPADRHARGQARAAEHLRGDDDPQRAPLQRLEARGRDEAGRRTHR
jgi:hypothetical protein